jgi:outer membrane biosynthesis protein TonB
MFRSSFARSIGPTLRQAVRQPVWLATALSVGVHGLLWAVLPILPSASLTEEPDDQRTVGVVELSPEEQARVPDFSTPSLELPPLSESDLYSLSPVPNQSPPTQLFPPFPPFPTNPYPSFEPPPDPSTTTRQTDRPTDQQTNPSPSPSPPPSPSPQDSGTVLPTNPGIAQNPDLDRLRGNVGIRPTPQSSPSPQDNRTAEQRLQSAIAQRRAANRLGRDSTGTTEREAVASLEEWVTAQSIATWDDDVVIAASYPQEACPLELETNAIYGVVISRENEIVDEPKLIRSSGYQLFNQKALEAIAAHDFENESNANQGYLVTVRFDYTDESCQAPAPAEPPPAG